MDADNCCLTHQQKLYEQALQRSAGGEEYLASLQEQARENDRLIHKVQAQLAEERKKEAAAVQAMVDGINNMRGAQFRVVPCDYEEKEKHKKFDHMVHNWDFVGLCDFFAAHGMVFVATKKTQENKQRVFALLPVENKVDYRASDIILSRVAYMFTTKCFEAKDGMFNMMELRRDCLIAVPTRNDKGFATTNILGHFEPSQHCVYGCEFCRETFNFDDNKHVYANLEVPVPDDEQPAKHRKTEENEAVHEAPSIYSSTVAARLAEALKPREHGRPRLCFSSLATANNVHKRPK